MFPQIKTPFRETFDYRLFLGKYAIIEALLDPVDGIFRDRRKAPIICDVADPDVSTLFQAVESDGSRLDFVSMKARICGSLDWTDARSSR